MLVSGSMELAQSEPGPADPDSVNGCRIIFSEAAGCVDVQLG